MNPYQELLSGDPPPQRFVLNGLRFLEADFREQALRALADWERSGLSVRDDAEAHANLFAAVAALQRPSWGHWNGLLTALRKARAAVRQSKSPDRLEQLAKAVQLERVVNWVETPLVPDLIAGLQPLRELVQPGLRGKLTLGQAVGMAITLRNRVSHDSPVDPAWWRQAAAAFRPLIAYCARTHGEVVGRDKGYPAPWFVIREGSACAFHGLEKSRVPLYVSRRGVSQPAPDAAQEVLNAFRRLLGQADVQERDFHKLLVRLAPEELQGVMLGDYLVGAPVASGGFATVHVGSQLSTGRKVAIKILQDGLSDEQRWRFQQEAAYLARFDHPHIVRVYGHGEDTWTRPKHDLLDKEGWTRAWSRSAPVKSYIALEWIDGPTMDEVFLRRKADATLPFEAALTVAGWFLQAARALEAVHDQNLIHRDLTPSNLMLTPDGRVKLMDFGIARTLSEARTLKTAKGDVLGKPAYMAPEQLRAEAAEAGVGSAADLYALCATFYELFTGVRLYHHDTTDPATVLTCKIQGEAPEPARRHRADLPWEIETIVDGGLQTEPVDRYSSAAALAEDLRRFLADEPILYRRPSLRRRVTLFARRNRALVRLSVGFLGIMSLVACGFGIALSVERANTAAKSQLASEKAREASEQTKLANEKTKIANEQRKLAKDKAKEASEQTKLAGEQSKLAREKVKEARSSDLLKRREFYSADMRAALRAWEENKPDEVRALLAKHDPRHGTGMDDLRGFEWYYLDRLLSGGFLALDIDGDARAVRFAPDGKRLAALSEKVTAFSLKLWKLPGGELERTIPLGRGTGMMVSESLTLLKQNLLGEQSVAFSPDGMLVAATCMIARPQQRDGIVKVWETSTGREIFTKTDAAIGGRAVEFSPDGRHLVVGGYKNAVLVWELEGGKLRWSLGAPDPTNRRNEAAPNIPRPGLHALPDMTPVVYLRFSHDGKTLLRWSGRLAPMAWPPAEPRNQGRFPDPVTLHRAEVARRLAEEAALTLAFNERWAVVAGSAPNAIQLIMMDVIENPELYETPGRGRPRYEKSRVATLSLDSGPIQRLAFGEPLYLAMNSRGGLVTLGMIEPNSRTWDGRYPLRGHVGDVLDLAFSPDGRKLAAAGSKRVTVWDTQGRPEVRPLSAVLPRQHPASRFDRVRTGIHSGEGVMTPDGRWVVRVINRQNVVPDGSGPPRSEAITRIEVFDAADPSAAPKTFDSPVAGITSVAISPDLSLCAIWNYNAREFNQRLKASSATGASPFRSPVPIDEPIYLLEAAAGQATRVRHVLKHNATSMMFSPDGRRLVSAAPVEKMVRLWDVDTGKEVRSFPVRANRVEFSPDGRWIVSGSPGGINLLSPESNEAVQSFAVDSHQPIWAFRPDGLGLALSAQGARIRVWNLQSNQQAQDFSAQGQTIEAMAFDPEGLRLFSSNSSGDITIWSLESGEDVFTIPSAGLTADQVKQFAAVIQQIERRWKAEAEAR